ncbi:MAG: hypothetical protein EPO68_10150 [Planctomycetota bacterium]|nr:MAG: hypothetical protein EPO68_10150 [Planctomycetota bacterium]
MAETPNRALVEALLQHGRAESPADLAARGVKQVRSVSLQRVSRLIDQAIQRTLLEHELHASGTTVVDMSSEAPSATSSDAALVLDRASARFRELVGAGRALEDSSRAIETEIDALVHELEALRERPSRESAVVERREQRVKEHKQQDALIEGAIGEVLGVLASRMSPEAGGEVLKVQGKVVEICLALIRDERQRALAAEVTAHDRQVEVLERRLAKTVEALRRAEDALRYVKSLKHVDDGIASIYSVVQGLDVGAEDAARKKELLSAIFEANVELRAQVAAVDEQRTATAAAPRRAEDHAPDLRA